MLRVSRAEHVISLSVAFFFICCASVSADDWPQWRGVNRDGVWREPGVIEAFPAPQIAIQWRTSISNGYSGPTIAAGRVYVTDRITEPAESERVLCFDASTGAEVWKQEYPCDYTPISFPNGPRAAVTIAGGLAYSLGAVGYLRCFDAATGALIWKKDPGVDYELELPIWGVAAAPLVEGDLLIAQIGAKPGGCLAAWDKRSGEERWRALEDPASYASPIVIDQAGRRLLICWTGDHLVGLNPATGDSLWEYATPRKKEVINVATPVQSGDRLFLTSVYDGSFLFRLGQDTPAVELLWRRCGENEIKTDGIQTMISTPVMQGDHIYGVDCYGQLRCLRGDNGDRVWEDTTAVTQTRWATIHMVQNADRVWMFNELGELILARLSPEGFQPLSRAKLIEPTRGQLGRGNGVCWSHPAFANRCVFARNDKELICADLAAN